jgi:hypothetical protein
MTPRLLIKSGVFYTWQKTKTKFIRRAPNDEKKLGGVAQVIAANIRVENNGYFALRVGGQEVRFNALPGRLYGVLFDNGCPKDVCNYNPDSPVKELRNDFHHYCETFEIPADREEYELAKDLASKSEYGEQQGADSARTTTGPFFEMFNALFGNMLSSDDAPCGAAGYGSSGCIHC